MHFKKIIIALVLGFVLINVLSTNLAWAGSFDTILSGFKKTGSNAGYQITGEGAPKKEFAVALATYANSFIVLMGALFLLMVIFGGWLWMTARGNDQQVERGKTLIIQATIGFGVVIISRILVEFIIFNLGELGSSST